MDELIMDLCHSLIDEAEAVIKNTERLKTASKPGLEEIARMYAINRLDSVEHIQNLTIALTTGLSNTLPEAGDDVE